VEKNKKWNLRSQINKGLEIPRVYVTEREKRCGEKIVFDEGK